MDLGCFETELVIPFGSLLGILAGERVKAVL